MLFQWTKQVFVCACNESLEHPPKGEIQMTIQFKDHTLMMIVRTMKNHLVRNGTSKTLCGTVFPSWVIFPQDLNYPVCKDCLTATQPKQPKAETPSTMDLL